MKFKLLQTTKGHRISLRSGVGYAECDEFGNTDCPYQGEIPIVLEEDVIRHWKGEKIEKDGQILGKVKITQTVNGVNREIVADKYA